MGQHSFLLHGLESHYVHTLHFTGHLPVSSLVCGQGEWKRMFGPLLFETGYTPIIFSSASRLGWNRPVYGPPLLFSPWP